MLRPGKEVVFDGFDYVPALLPNLTLAQYQAATDMQTIRRSTMHESYIAVLPGTGKTWPNFSSQIYKVIVPPNSYLLGVVFPYSAGADSTPFLYFKMKESDTGDTLMDWYTGGRQFTSDLGPLYLHKPRLLLSGRLDVEVGNNGDQASPVGDSTVADAQILFLFAIPRPYVVGMGGNYCD